MAAEDDAERVADRVGKDSEAGLTFTMDTSGAEGEQFLLGLLGLFGLFGLFGISWG